jgi:hypothetical protein
MVKVLLKIYCGFNREVVPYLLNSSKCRINKDNEKRSRWIKCLMMLGRSINK